MSGDELEMALQAFARRRPFGPFQIEFNSGDRILVSHPECVRRYQRLLPRPVELFRYVGPGRSQRVFSAASVCQLIDTLASS